MFDPLSNQFLWLSDSVVNFEANYIWQFNELADAKQILINP